MYIVKKPQYGDQIRVNRGLYYHHGIYVSDEHVIHFASLEPGHETDPNSAMVVDTPLDVFLKGGQVEVREYEENLKDKVRSKQDIVNYAYSCLGRKGYNIITNNCEHFSNECAFGKRESEQVNQVLDILSSLFVNSK